MKICLRYPFPKSLPSGKGLTIASLQSVYSVYIMQRMKHSQMLWSVSANVNLDGRRFLLR